MSNKGKYSQDIYSISSHPLNPIINGFHQGTIYQQSSPENRLQYGFFAKFHYICLINGGTPFFVTKSIISASFVFRRRKASNILEGGMMAEQPQGCARVTGKVSGNGSEEKTPVELSPMKMEKTMTAKVGQKAPDFTAPAYYRGGFTTVKLSDYAGKWVLLCFYPGDFTFV